MVRPYSGIWLLVLVLLCATSTVRASASFENGLLEADKLRSVDHSRFAVLLDELNTDKQQASEAQLHHLQYLRAYQSVVHRNQVEEGIATAKALFEHTKAVDLKFRAGSLLVNSYAINRNFTEGLRYLNLTLSMRHRVHAKDIRQDGLDAAAAFYNQMGQYKIGLQYAQETLSDTPNPRALCIARLLQMESQFHLDMLPAEDAAIRHGIDQCLAIGEKLMANLIRVLLARKWAASGQAGDAISLLEEHLREVNSIDYHFLIAEVRSLLAELYLRNGEPALAQRHAVEAIAQAEHVSSSLSLVSAYRILYQIAEREGDSVAALALYRRYADADKAHISDVKARELAYEIVRHETLQKTQQIELLHGENQLLLLQQRVDQQANQNTRLMMLLLALLVALIGYWAYKVKRVQQSLRRFAETDALTGISNRHHFTVQTERALAQSAADGEACALIMFDLDHFKTINDSYGHDIGDWVLNQVARTCEGLCRRIDQFGRLGGEEFAILLRGIDLASATRLAEDCRVRLTQIDSRESGHAFVVTASFGVSATPLAGYNLAKLLSHADQMLYSGKRSGRNRVNAYTGDLFNPAPLQVVPRSDGLPPKHAGPLVAQASAGHLAELPVEQLRS